MGHAAAGRRTGLRPRLDGWAPAPSISDWPTSPRLDMTLTFFMLLALVSFWMAQPGAGRLWWYGVFTGAALAYSPRAHRHGAPGP